LALSQFRSQRVKSNQLSPTVQLWPIAWYLSNASGESVFFYSFFSFFLFSKIKMHSFHASSTATGKSQPNTFSFRQNKTKIEIEQCGVCVIFCLSRITADFSVAAVQNVDGID